MGSLENQGEFVLEDEQVEQLYLFLSRCYFNIGQLDKATILLEEATTIYPNNSNFFELLANMYAQSNNFEKAVIYLEKAHEISPNNVGISENLDAWRNNK